MSLVPRDDPDADAEGADSSQDPVTKGTMDIETKGKKKEKKDARENAEKWQIQHILFPAMRRYLVPPKSLLDRDVVQVASLPELYKVFERC